MQTPMTLTRTGIWPPNNEPDPRLDVFGYGRRICPGQHFADATVFLTIAQLVAAFDIGSAIDEFGREIPVKLELSGGIVGYVADFPYSVKPRSEKYAQLIRA